MAAAGVAFGRVLTEPMAIPDVARIAVLSDPQGAAFALHERAAR